MDPISDDQWLEANLAPKAYRAALNISIPDLPSEEVQRRFTARNGRENLQQAFDFYKFVLQHLPRDSQARYRVVDFGGGWGRVLRFFLREIPADRLILLDCLTDAVECARSLNPPFTITQNDIAPPSPLEKTSADCCFAFSVFSHLSEQACSNWLSHLGELLVPGGRLILTTRGKAQIDGLRHLRRPTGPMESIRKFFQVRSGHHANALVELLPPPGTIERIYDKGVFQFYATGGGGELTKDFYGEAWIPEQWMKDRYHSLGFNSCVFFREFATIDQCVFVLTK